MPRKFTFILICTMFGTKGAPAILDGKANSARWLQGAQQIVPIAVYVDTGVAFVTRAPREWIAANQSTVWTIARGMACACTAIAFATLAGPGPTAAHSSQSNHAPRTAATMDSAEKANATADLGIAGPLAPSSSDARTTVPNMANVSSAITAAATQDGRARHAMWRLSVKEIVLAMANVHLVSVSAGQGGKAQPVASRKTVFADAQTAALMGLVTLPLGSVFATTHTRETRATNIALKCKPTPTLHPITRRAQQNPAIPTNWPSPSMLTPTTPQPMACAPLITVRQDTGGVPQTPAHVCVSPDGQDLSAQTASAPARVQVAPETLQAYCACTGGVYASLDTTAAAVDSNPTPPAQPRVQLLLGPHASTAYVCATPRPLGAQGRAWASRPPRSATSRRAQRMCSL